MFDFACASGRGSRLYLADYFRYILSAIYYPSGLFSVFRQSEENFRSLSKLGHGTDEIYFGTCLHLGHSLNRFLQLDQYANYTFFRFLNVGWRLGNGWLPVPIYQSNRVFTSIPVACTENKVKYFTLQSIFFDVLYTQSTSLWEYLEFIQRQRNGPYK